MKNFLFAAIMICSLPSFAGSGKCATAKKAYVDTKSLVAGSIENCRTFINQTVVISAQFAKTQILLEQCEVDNCPDLDELKSLQVRFDGLDTIIQNRAINECIDERTELERLKDKALLQLEQDCNFL